VTAGTKKAPGKTSGAWKYTWGREMRRGIPLTEQPHNSVMLQTKKRPRRMFSAEALQVWVV